MYAIRNKTSGRYLTDPPDGTDGGDGYTDDPEKALRFNRCLFATKLATPGEEVVDLEVLAGSSPRHLPWRVRYPIHAGPGGEGLAHSKADPTVVDARGFVVFSPRRTRPITEYDACADQVAHAIVNAVNAPLRPGIQAIDVTQEPDSGLYVACVNGDPALAAHGGTIADAIGAAVLLKPALLARCVVCGIDRASQARDEAARARGK